MTIRYRKFGLGKGKKHYAAITGEVASQTISNIINNYNKLCLLFCKNFYRSYTLQSTKKQEIDTKLLAIEKESD